MQDQCTLDEAILHLHEFGLQVNEFKKQGIKAIQLDTYESFLNWTIDSLTIINDKYYKF